MTDPDNGAGDESKDQVEEADARLKAKRKELGIKHKPVPEPQIPTTHIGHPRTHKGLSYDTQDTQAVPAPQGQISGWEVGVSKGQVLAELEQHRIPTESLEEFIQLAVIRNNERFNDRLEIAAELGSSSSTRYHWSPCFTFAAILSGHPELKGLRSPDLYKRVNEVLGPDGWNLLPDCDVWGNPVDPRDDLLRCWRKIDKPFYLLLKPEGAMPLVDSYPLTCGDWPGDEYSNYRRTVSLCFWYAKLLQADGEFFLSCRTAGTLVGVSYRWANEYLERAEKEDRVLVCLKKGKVIRGEKKNPASEYRFNYERVTFASD